MINVISGSLKSRHSYLHWPYSQCFPPNSGLHRQKYLFPSTTHCPPFRQGRGLHGFASSENQSSFSYEYLSMIYTKSLIPGEVITQIIRARGSCIKCTTIYPICVCVDFREGGKPEYPEKNPIKQWANNTGQYSTIWSELFWKNCLRYSSFFCVLLCRMLIC